MNKSLQSTMFANIARDVLNMHRAFVCRKVMLSSLNQRTGNGSEET